MKDWKPSDLPENVVEQYRIDVDDPILETILESADGSIELDEGILTRYMPECGGKSEVPSFLMGELDQLYKSHYKPKNGTHGILFEQGRLCSRYEFV